MAQNVLTNRGFERPSLTALVQRIGDRMEAAVGPISREPKSNTGQFIGSVAEELAIAYETSEAIWLSRFIESASGYALDAIGEWMGGTQRRGRTRTQVNAVVYGEESIPVKAGALASFQNNNFALESDVTITRGNLVDGTINVTNATQTTYTIRANGFDYSYTRKASDTQTSIAAGLAAMVESGSAVFTAKSNGSRILLSSRNLIEGYPASVGAGMTWIEIGSPAVFQAVNYGPISVPVGGLNNPVSAISGWSRVNNLVGGSVGSDRESDASYRQRLKNSLGNAQGKATVDAIKAALLNEVDGVTLVEVLENDTMQATSTIKAKSILCIVDGGLEQAIAQKIWDYKGDGISTSGDLLITATDASGRPKGVRFSRSTAIPIVVRVVVTRQDPESVIPGDIISLIEQGVANYFATLSLGDDVIIQKIPGYIFANTTGIAKMEVTASANGGAFSGDDISIDAASTANLTDVEVSGV